VTLHHTLALLLVFFSSALVAGCSIDTELGVAAEISSATVTIAGTGADAAASVMVDVVFRVGDHAQGARTFVATRVEILPADRGHPVNLDRPPAFDGTLSPGESESVTYMGTSPAANIDADVCGLSVVTVRLPYAHRDAADPSGFPEMDAAEFETSDINCR